MKRDLRFEAVYPHSIDKVWRAIADREAISAWLMSTDFEPRVGHKFKFRAKPVGGWDGIVNCEVLECAPPRRLAYTWTSNKLKDTRVAFTLDPVGGGTRLVLEHSGFDGVKEIMISFILGSGWKGMVAKRIGEVIAAMDAEGRLPEHMLNRSCP